MFYIITMFAPQNGGQGGSSLMSFLPFILIIVIMYFLMIRPQMKRQKERQKMVDALQKGDNVITTGGIHGKIAGFSDDGKTILLQIDEKVKVHVDRSAVTMIKGSGKE